MQDGYTNIITLSLLSIFWGAIAWIWTPRADAQAKDNRFRMRSCVHALWTSFLIMVSAAMMLALANLFSRLTWTALVLAISLPRAYLLIRASTRRYREPLVSFFLPGVFLLASCLAPDPGNWMAGGWDPGIYMNQGLAMARSGSLQPDDSWFSEWIPENDQSSFLRVFPTRRERHPGVVIEGTRTSYQFSRFFPSAIGLFAAWGGVELASRLNYFIALMGLLTACAWGMSISGAGALIFPFILVVQPIFTYHTHIPVSEMLELGIVLWAGMMLFQKQMSSGDSLRMAFGLLCSILNRFSMVPFSGIFLLLGAIVLLAIELPTRTRLRFAGLYLLATLTGLAMSFRFAPVSIRGWSVTPLLLKVFWAGSISGIIILLVPIRRSVRAKLNGLIHKLAPVGLPVLLLLSLAIMVWYGRRPEQVPYLEKLMPFLGAGWAILFVFSALFVGNIFKRGAGALVVFLSLFSVTIMMLIAPQITTWYPWALRRYLPFSVPLLALVILLMYDRLEKLIPLGWAKMQRVIPIALLIGAFLMSGNTFLEGLRLREYRGLAGILRNVSDHIPDNAVIVSDDPCWGTPLHLAFGHKVLFGRGLWRRAQSEEFQHILGVLSALPDDHEVFFLTSLAEGMDIYPQAEPPYSFETVNQFPPFTLLTIIQHPCADYFALQPLNREFKLHKLHRE